MLQPLGNQRGWRHVGDVVACPVCDRRSVYSEQDRFFHCDGSVNIQCWVAISRGGLVARPVVVRGADDAGIGAGMNNAA